MGDTVAAYKVADMYKNGFFVEKDYEKYKSIIEELYPTVRKASMLWEPLPEVFTRLAAIRAEEGRTDEALDLYDRARDFLSQRIRCGSFFGDLSIMKWMIESIYKLREFDPDAVGHVRLPLLHLYRGTTLWDRRRGNPRSSAHPPPAEYVYP